MPDPSANDRVVMRPLGNLGNSERTGGIVSSSHYKGLSVEIRPSRWKRKFWIGKLKTLERAQHVADAVFHYLGMPPFHLKEGVMTLPAITCIGTVIGTPVELSTQEMCASYVSAIAKGQDFEPQREDFILQVKNVVLNPDFPILAPPRTEVVVLDDDDRDREEDLEFDEDAAKALQMSSHSAPSGVPVAVVQTHVAGPDSVGGSEAVQAFIPGFGFDSNGSENILQSEEQSFPADLFRMEDCPTTGSEGEKIWIESIEEIEEGTAAGISTPSVASNDGEVCRDGYETSPILDIPPGLVRPCASSKFFGVRVERAVPARTAPGSSPDKRQRIGD